MIRQLFKPITNTFKHSYQYQPLSLVSKHFFSQEPQNTPKKRFLDTPIASPTFKARYMYILPCMLSMLSIGTPLNYALMYSALTKEIGFVCPSVYDWTIGQITYCTTIGFTVLGLTTFGASNWQIKNGVRQSMLTASVLFAAGHYLGAAGIYFHNLTMTYAGLGLLVGLGMGFQYTQPVQVLCSWYPDRKGFAGGVTVAGFGLGAALMTQIYDSLTKQFQKMPTFLGKESQVNLTIQDGKLFILDNQNKLVEVVNANARDIAVGGFDLQDGVYLLNSGNTGIAQMLVASGSMYFLLMSSLAMMLKIPHPDFLKKFEASQQGGFFVSPGNALKTYQFWSMVSMYGFCSLGGYAIMAASKAIMSDVFIAALPAVITAAFCKKYATMLAVGTIIGRVGYSSISDYLGRRFMYNLYVVFQIIFFFLNIFIICNSTYSLGGISMFLTLPFLVQQVCQNGSIAAFYGFVGATLIISTFLGGTFATFPAYCGDYFGNKYVGAIYGRVMLGVTIGIQGPVLLLFLKNIEEQKALLKLVSEVDPELFFKKFGVTLDQAEMIIKTKVLTISKIMEIMPIGTVDPTPYTYNLSLYTIAALTSFAFFANYFMKPLNSKYLEYDQKKVENVVEFSEEQAKQGKKI